ncbi:GNAT family N-acetyltransferase [Egicoccus halophilus]|uniref:N-acetyltransferase domain-containing protein n=1 Tax=Egicoccus halophilus TaxID=1670830 RepID=A0A8J3ACI0_9ACTN|nr:GNAT family N-acetyltransferase [Egicoccus halophilus]GGI08494.1 hypothetical protein GCM10011354_29360 [Egicoccus halophilus]
MVQLDLGPADLSAVARFVAEQQHDPASHIGYLSLDPEPVAAELAALEPVGTDGLVVAVDRGRLVGVIAAEWDTDPPRCWWHGPFVARGVDPTEVADALLARARTLLPVEVTQEEACGDARHAWLEDWAGPHGFVAQEASAVLARRLDTDLPTRTVVTVPGTVLDAVQRAAVATLHDRLFVDTHTPGARLVADDADRLLAVLDGDRPVGYAVVERHEDGSGYLDFLGVDPTARGHGVGTGLVAAACAELRTTFRCDRAHLTVRVGNAAARRVYAATGFVEERVLVPLRRGFALP